MTVTPCQHGDLGSSWCRRPDKGDFQSCNMQFSRLGCPREITPKIWVQTLYNYNYNYTLNIIFESLEGKEMCSPFRANQGLPNHYQLPREVNINLWKIQQLYILYTSTANQFQPIVTSKITWLMLTLEIRQFLYVVQRRRTCLYLLNYWSIKLFSYLII